MNAYELADKMDTKGFRYREVKAAVVMLRQQADRIAELEKEKKAMAEVLKDCENVVEEANSNAEPVAWIVQSKYGIPTLTWAGDPMKYNANSAKQQAIPLYTTTQTKPLSDKEIMKEIEKGDWYSLSFKAGVRFAEERILGK